MSQESQKKGSKKITESKTDTKNIIEIKLTGKYANGEVAVITKNPKNEELAKYRWYKTPNGYVANSTLGCLHKVVLGIEKKDPREVDHIDKNKLNITHDNLRIATRSQNNFNRNTPVGKSGRIGVNQVGDKWKAAIRHQTKSIHIGTFATKEEAIKAREDAEIKYFGFILQNNRVYKNPTDKPEIKIEGDIVYVPLTTIEGKEQKYTKIDLDKLDMVVEIPWRSHGGRAHNFKKGYLHQYLTNYQYEKVDHINQDCLDNRIKNLRPVTQSQNGMNRPEQSNNTSGVSGVSFKKSSLSWQAYIKINNQQISLGGWKTKEEAIKMRQYWECKLFGEFSRYKKETLASKEEIENLMKTKPNVRAFKQCNFDVDQFKISKEEEK